MINQINFLGELKEYNTGSIDIDYSNIANGSIFGSKISWVTGRSGSALQVSGATADGDGYVRISGGLANFFNPNNGAVSLWIKNPSPGSGADFIFNGNTNNRTRMIASTGSISMGKGNPQINVIPTTALIADEWNHCVLTWEPSGAIETNGSYWAYGYINDTLLGSGVFRDTSSGTHYVLFGIGTAGQEPSNVSIDDFRVYNKTLIAEEVSTLFGDGDVTDSMVIRLKMDEGTGSIAFNVANTNVSHYTDHINGKIHSVQIIPNNVNSTGSILIFASGTGELLSTKTGGVPSNVIRYPFVYGTERNGGTGSPIMITNYTVNGPIAIVGSGFEAETSLTNIRIQYR